MPAVCLVCLTEHWTFDGPSTAQYGQARKYKKHARSPGLDLELHEVCTEKKESLVVTDIKAFRAVADLLQCKIPVPKATEEVQLSELAMSKFELLKKQLDYDQTAFRVHQAKVKNYEHAVHHAKLEWKQKLRSEAMQWRTSWLAKKCKIFVYDPSHSGELTKLASDHAQTLIKGAGWLVQGCSCNLACLLLLGCPATNI